MAVTSKNLRSVQRMRPHPEPITRRLQATLYGCSLLLAALAVYAVISVLVGHAHTMIDDLTYGRPRTVHTDAFVGHHEEAGTATHLIAMNINRQVLVVELPGGDPAQARTIAGPYLFGADEDLTPVHLSLHDMDADGQLDLLLDVRREQIVYLNKDGGFRLPTPAEQAQLTHGGHR